MSKMTRFVGLDVHADTISVAVAEDGRCGEDVRKISSTLICCSSASTRRSGSRVTLGLKGGRVCHGVLGTFDAESEVGMIGDTVVVAGQVLGVEPGTKQRDRGERRAAR